ncbi:putative secreted protein (Por secretion system target) [Arcicella aurantiaca]|uniref:Putative secreted protein (Por secretion system target) n=1 Tax=Arcicella aurantiaca TaxID=591202 RepID=A0A316E529_9BACT|nr:pectinesterase family protein [Arcicella aurantiaca]PWK23813.1 putative secreted protein (Por secretion system target) [Arcicella aurantiaca]
MKKQSQIIKFIPSTFSFFLLLLTLSYFGVSQRIAFPGAEGGGRYAIGGRGGTVYEVTNLNDAGVGSLRDAISEGNRTIIFKVSGEIKLQSRLSIKKDNITIAGQTAPGEGICLTGYTLNISASNIIVRYIRCRFGDANAVDDDAMNCWNGAFQNIIIDHCSMSWSIDETATFYGIKNFTLQWCLVAESLYRSKHDKGDHGYAGIWGGANATFHHNLVAHHTSRNPRFGGTRKGYIPYEPSEELVDYRNNVIYNWGNINSSYGGEGAKINMVNNYYKAGPATAGNLTTSSTSNKRNRILNYTSYYAEAGVDTLFGGKFYIDGNYVDGFPDVSADNWAKGVQKDSYARASALIATNKQTEPFKMVSTIKVQSAIDAYKAVLDSVGAILPRRDGIDTRIVYETKTGTATYEGAAYAAVKDAGVSHPSGIIDSPANVGGIPKYGSNTAYIDTDKDGMPDAWEISKGLNPNNASDGNLIASNDYTNLENYLNSITGDTGTGTIVGGSGSNNPIIDLMGYDAVVAKDGTGSFKTVQDAINSVVINGTKAFRIFIKNGKYLEKVTIASNKPFIHLIGESAAKTIISWNDYSGKIVSGVTIGTSTSTTLAVKAADCLLMNLTIENSTGDSPQAVALSLEADRDIVKSCILLGGQDTFLANGDGKRQYIKNTYIDGVVDFIFGSSTAVFDSCVIYAKDRVDKLSGSYITAANTPSGQAYGYVFRNCTLPSNTGVTAYVLGRPWQNDASTADAAKKNNKVVFLNSVYGDKIIKSEGWSTWDSGTNTSLITYAEYKPKKYNGISANISSRVAWSKQLSDAEANPYLSNSIVFNNWEPCTSVTDLCKTTTPEIAVVNLKVKKGADLSIPTTFNWNVVWAMKDLKYELLRSTDNKATFSAVKTITATTDTLINFNTSDDAPAANKQFYYILKVSKSGLKTYFSDTISVSSIPTITVSGSPKDFLQGMGTPSIPQVYSLAGVNLAENLTIKVPTNFEISVDGGKTWNNDQRQIVLSITNGSFGPTNVQVRLNANVAGTYTGIITHTSTGATTQNININGITQKDPLPVTQTLAFWSMNVNNADSLALRAKGVIPQTPTLKRLTLSNGSVIAPYSILHGQCIAPSADGGGLWTTAGGGNANNLHRGIYEQFVIKAQANFSVKVDSLILKSSLYQAATGKLAVVYSKSAFKADSTDVSGGILPDGTPMLSAANGAFATPLILASDPASTTTLYKMALKGNEGINLASGDSLTVRLYYSTGSGSTGRYAKIKDLQLKGSSKDLTVKPPVVTITSALNDFLMTEGQAVAVQNYTISAENLTSDITITAPTNFEISSDAKTWASILKLTSTLGKLAQTTVSIRPIQTLKSGTYSGEIVHTTQGAVAQNIPVKSLVTLPLSTENESLETTITVNPNPVQNILKVSHPNGLIHDSLSIYSLGGTKINTFMIQHGSTSTSINVSNLAEGVYLLQYQSENGNKAFKFIKL